MKVLCLSAHIKEPGQTSLIVSLTWHDIDCETFPSLEESIKVFCIGFYFKFSSTENGI